MTTGESELDTRGTEHRVVWIRLVRRDVSVATIGLLLLLVSTALVQNPPAGWETSIFHSINDLPRQAKWLVWPLQQAGMALAVPAGAAVLWMVVRNLRPPVALITGGIVFGWAGAKLIKEVVQRGRPGALLEDVNYGFATHIEGLGFPSGHAVVAFTLAWVWAPYEVPHMPTCPSTTSSPSWAAKASNCTAHPSPRLSRDPTASSAPTRTAPWTSSAAARCGRGSATAQARDSAGRSDTRS